MNALKIAYIFRATSCLLLVLSIPFCIFSLNLNPHTEFKQHKIHSPLSLVFEPQKTNKISLFSPIHNLTETSNQHIAFSSVDLSSDNREIEIEFCGWYVIKEDPIFIIRLNNNYIFKKLNENINEHLVLSSYSSNSSRLVAIDKIQINSKLNNEAISLKQNQKIHYLIQNEN